MAALRGALRLTRPVAQAVHKTSTGLVGLKVDLNGRANLIAMQQQLLEAVKAIPETAAYRQSVEATATYRLKVATEETDEEAIEKTIGFGQLEELIEQGKDEMELIDYYAGEKGWEMAADLAWQADVDADIKQDVDRDDKEQADAAAKESA
uniref:NADH dehydrogenase [ubiquinone] 1 alpha subcomplex subunit 5 n=1 Tax=Florenciella parvula TaxID=236787 RepID=A0A7S2BEJ1_9STRA|mmetsp:Transcript_16061/g.33539  ORF Transcript_16061/g.33539 Transcript_16061/m.33539 type:complete len:151 (+) Transcript_16061:28-480(+)|eukprot:CAMPEP_0119541746 /NCGR_PEP_ID=MMETSP1344-20130328/53149_1 /TAXON_ID=236787 /ORGANISM="Florenciella parvula, Strain CCMP2471" /LENGTH=150 /DNA_ID=CAMNT_0007585797 /DNA_START=25 /DNA_END=477 /DNA_ORIENTATION=+